MAKLVKQKTNQVLLADLGVAKNLWSRTKGLLGTKSLGEEQGLWIHRCNSIHTFFMRYSIDCVFLDKDMKVKAVKTDVKPGRVVLPVWGANSVIEMKSGLVKTLNIAEGDHLYVGT